MKSICVLALLLTSAMSAFAAGSLMGSADDGDFDSDNSTDVTETYLVEKSGFSRSDEPYSTSYSRFGTLAEPWVVSENILNQGDGKGGFDNLDGKQCISVEKWYDGMADIIDGYIYQTTKAELPAGTYKLNVGTYGYYTHANCCIAQVVEGSDFMNGTVLASQDMNAYNNTTSWYDMCSFTITEPTVVSIGWKINMPSGYWQINMRVTEIKLCDDSGDLSADYISNNTNIQRSDDPVANYYRFGTPANWTPSNFSIPTSYDGTKQGIDTWPGYNCLHLEKWGTEAASDGVDLSKAILYRKVCLPAGKYQFSETTNYAEGEQVYLFAATQPLTYSENGDAIAYTSAAWTSGTTSIVFSLDEAQDVYLGFNANLAGNQTSWRFSEVGLKVENQSATMTIGSAHYSTFCAPFDVEIPEGVTASKVTGTNGYGLTTEALSETIPANTPVLLYSENEVSQTFTGAPVAGTPTAGLLTGVYTTTAATDGTYILQSHDGIVKFYRVDTSEAQPNVPANRAYLTVQGETDIKAFGFDVEEADAIRTVEAAGDQSTDIYNLSGQKLSGLQKGVNIVGGKKVIK